MASIPERPVPISSPPRATAPGGGGREALAYFSAAFLFLLAGVVGLFLHSSAIADGGITSPPVAGAIHWITLGWLSTSIFGALQVFGGVALGAPSLGPRFAFSSLGVWVLGLALFPAGLMLGERSILLTGLGVLSLGLLLQSAQMAAALFRARRGNLTRAYLAGALLSLWCAWGLGAANGAALAGSHLWPSGTNFFSAHLLLALFGWTGAAIVGVGTHLIPMFALATDFDRKAVRIALPCWASLPLFALLGACGNASALEIGWWLAALGSALWALQVWTFFRHRIRKEGDAGLRLALIATTALMLSWVFLGSTGASTVFAAAILFGWLTLFTLGIYHRVIPFLVWMWRFGGKSQTAKPNVRELTNHSLATVTVSLSVAGTALWLVGFWLSRAEWIKTGFAILFLGAMSASFQLCFLFRKFEAPRSTLVKTEARYNGAL